MARKKSEAKNGEKRFEELIDELSTVVASLESGELPLEESMEAFRRGVEISRECHARLDEAERKVMVLKKQSGGEVVEEPFGEPED